MYSEFYLPNSEEQKSETGFEWGQVNKRDKVIQWPFQINFEGSNMRLRFMQRARAMSIQVFLATVQSSSSSVSHCLSS